LKRLNVRTSKRSARPPLRGRGGKREKEPSQISDFGFSTHPSTAPLVPFVATAVRDGGRDSGSGQRLRQGQSAEAAPERTGVENVDQAFGLSKRQVMAPSPNLASAPVAAL
jgi:hypothetical protein